MPDIVTHTYFSTRVLNRLEGNCKNHIANKDLFAFAAGGPDPFFFYRFLKKKENKEVRAIGNRMHKEHTGAFFLRMIEELKTEANKDELFSYFAGFITHYALDSFIHPYVFHKTGVYEEENPKDLTYRGLHTKLERAIDCYIIRNHYHEKPNTFKIHKKILTLSKLPKEVWDGLNNVYKDVYEVDDAAKLVNESVKCQRKFYRFIYDPTGIKNTIFGWIDRKTTGLDYTVLSYYNKEIEHRDILNAKSASWTNPLDKKIISNDSLFVLFEKAEQFATTIIESAFRVVYFEEDLNLAEIIGNLSYLTGLDITRGHDMKYFNNIFA